MFVRGPDEGGIGGCNGSGGPLPGRCLESVTVIVSLQFLRIDQKHIHYIHLIHQLVRKPPGEKNGLRQLLRSVAGRLRSRHGVQ